MSTKNSNTKPDATNSPKRLRIFMSRKERRQLDGIARRMGITKSKLVAGWAQQAHASLRAPALLGGGAK